MQIITASVIKGGTGKTATCASLAQAGIADKKKVLAIDLDPQANLTRALGANQNQDGSYQLLHGADPLSLIQKTEQKIDVISASPDLAMEKTSAGSAMRLKNAIKDIKDKYHFIFIDTPPHIGDVTFNALMASTGLIIPLEADNNSLQGLYQIADITHQLQDTNKDLRILGAILTRFDPRPKVNKFWMDTIKEQGESAGVPFLGYIRAGVAVKEANTFQRSLFDYAPKSKPAQDYIALYKAIKKR